MLPSENEGKFLALSLLLIPIIVVCVVFRYTIVIPHNEMSKELDNLTLIHKKLRKLERQKQSLEEALVEWKMAQQGSKNNFLNQSTFSLAAADLQARIKELVWSQDTSGSHCRVLSQQNVLSKPGDLYTEVAVKIKAKCKIAELQNIIYDIETQTPILIVDNIMISRAGNRGRGNTAAEQVLLDVHFTVKGYIRAGNVKPEKA